MQVTGAQSVVVFGTLRSDGTVALHQSLPLKPGPIQVTICALAQPPEHLPDAPPEDAELSAWIDLPHFGDHRLVNPVGLTTRMPDPVEAFEVQSRCITAPTRVNR